MQPDFHYYLTCALAAVSRTAQSDIIAYSCQFVDDNNEGQFAISGQDVAFPVRLQAQDLGEHYYPIMTQSLSPKSLDPFVQKYVYVPFHFLPGDNTVVINNHKNPLNTTPNSANARKLLATALDSANPYRIGIALHTFADTWSHQNFTGVREDWNAIHPWYDLFTAMVPNIGHAEAGRAPDSISETWTDYRFKQVIDNKSRALAAAAAIYQNLAQRSQGAPAWNTVQADFKAFIDEQDYDTRIRNIVAYVRNKCGLAVRQYDEKEWINSALDKTSGATVTLAPGFATTSWYQFHQAAKAHLALVMGLVSDIL